MNSLNCKGPSVKLQCTKKSANFTYWYTICPTSMSTRFLCSCEHMIRLRTDDNEIDTLTILVVPLT